MSLVELLVTMVIAGVVLPLIFGVLIGAQKNTSRTAATSNAVAEAQLGLATIDRQVRSGSAPLFVGASGQAFGFYTEFADDGTPMAPRCVQYKVEGATLRARSFAATATPTPAWASARLVIRDVAPPVAPKKTFAQGPSPSSISITLRVAGGSTRPARVDSLLTTRNTADAASTNQCNNLS